MVKIKTKQRTQPILNCEELAKGLLWKLTNDNTWEARDDMAVYDCINAAGDCVEVKTTYSNKYYAVNSFTYHHRLQKFVPILFFWVDDSEAKNLDEGKVTIRYKLITRWKGWRPQHSKTAKKTSALKAIYPEDYPDVWEHYYMTPEEIRAMPIDKEVEKEVKKLLSE